MGIFNFKKQKSKTQSDDINILSGNGLLQYIVENLENPTEEKILQALNKITQPAEDLEHLTEDGELPWGWLRVNKDFLDKIETQYSYFLNLWLENRFKSPKEHYQALKSFVLYLEDTEKLCVSKGECFEFWFYHILASKEYIFDRKEELKELTTNLSSLQEAYNHKQEQLKDLEERVFLKLSENNGILQSDFYKLFDPCVKNEILNLLYYWEKESVIEKQKSGRSYKIYIKE